MSQVMLYVDEYGWWRADSLDGSQYTGRGKTKQDALFQLQLAIESARLQWETPGWTTTNYKLEMTADELDVIEINARLTQTFLETLF
ncbi:MAG: hypothetical protein WCF84_21425 [Anaerolineae bacterium]